MKYYLIAGEASGDLHGSNLMKSLRELDQHAEFRFWGGDLMLQQGGTLVKHYRELAFMGFLEVLLHLSTILNNLRLCKHDIQEFKPDVVILIDYPGFNLRMAKQIKSMGIPVYYYISPQLWAWNESRVKTIQTYVDHMFVILPFEEAFYLRHHYPVDFVGHPLLDVIHDDFVVQDRAQFILKNQLDQRPIIALLPGSRKQEIKLILEVMLSVVDLFPKYQFVIAGAPSISDENYSALLGRSKVRVVFQQTYDLLKHADAALVTSGTATLETALLQTPQVVCYKGNPISYTIAKRLVKVKFISLVNLIMDRMIVKELIQNELNTESVAKELTLILQDADFRQRVKEDYHELRMKLGGGGASHRTASQMIQYLSKKEVNKSKINNL